MKRNWKETVEMLLQQKDIDDFINNIKRLFFPKKKLRFYNDDFSEFLKTQNYSTFLKKMPTKFV